jgi:hypothetical protein
MQHWEQCGGAQREQADKCQDKEWRTLIDDRSYQGGKASDRAVVTAEIDRGDKVNEGLKQNPGKVGTFEWYLVAGRSGASQMTQTGESQAIEDKLREERVEDMRTNIEIDYRQRNSVQLLDCHAFSSLRQKLRGSRSETMVIRMKLLLSLFRKGFCGR